MMSVSMVIKGGKIVTPYGIFQGGVAVDQGKIVAIGKNTHLPHADIYLDCEEHFILPGVIDSHVHCREPGFTHKEDFKSCTTAAAAAGITTIMDMPNTKPPITNAKNFLIKRKKAEKKSLIDFAIEAAVTPKNTSILRNLKEMGAISFEIFTSDYPKDLLISESSQLYTSLRALEEIDGIAGIYSEDRSIVATRAHECQRVDRNDVLAYMESRSNISEATSVARTLGILRFVKTRLLFRQISTKEAIEEIRSLKPYRKGLYVEVSPHHLLLTSDYTKKAGPFGIVNPLLRSKRDTESLWEALYDGVVDIIATDHAPHTKQEKESAKADIWKTPPGLPGVETMLPLMLTQVNKGVLRLESLVKLICEAPSKIFGLYPRKGAIQVGSEADFTVVDIREEKEIKAEELHSKCGWSPYDGWRVRGNPVYTIVRGEIIMDHGQIVGRPGYGRFVQ